MVNVRVIYDTKFVEYLMCGRVIPRCGCARQASNFAHWAANNFTLIFFQLFRPRTRLVNAYAGACPNCR